MGALSRVHAGLLPFALGFLVAIVTNIVWMPAVNGVIARLFPNAKTTVAVRTAVGSESSDNADGADDISVFGLPEVHDLKDLDPAKAETSFIRNRTWEEVLQFAKRSDVQHAVYIALNDGCGHCMEFKDSGALAKLIKLLGSIYGHIIHVNDGKGGVDYPNQVTYLPFIGVVDATGTIREIKAVRTDFEGVATEVANAGNATDVAESEASDDLQAGFAARIKPGRAVPL